MTLIEAWYRASRLAVCTSEPAYWVAGEDCAHFIADGAIVYRQACALGCEGIVSKRLGSTYRSSRADCWVKVKNPAAPAVRREAEEEWN
jgi:bifunctional non-homologous end joining protein LigD